MCRVLCHQETRWRLWGSGEGPAERKQARSPFSSVPEIRVVGEQLTLAFQISKSTTWLSEMYF